MGELSIQCDDRDGDPGLRYWMYWMSISMATSLSWQHNFNDWMCDQVLGDSPFARMITGSTLNSRQIPFTSMYTHSIGDDVYFMSRGRTILVGMMFNGVQMSGGPMDKNKHCDDTIRHSTHPMPVEGY